MKKLIVPLVLSFVFSACEKKASVETEQVVMPMEFGYKGNFAIGKMQDVKTVVECNRRLSSLDTNIGEFIADSMIWHMPDGTLINASRDSAMKVLKQFISSLSAMKIQFITAIPVTNTTTNDDWVLSWTEETYTYKDGRTDHAHFMETVRMKDGKIRELYQYTRLPEGASASAPITYSDKK